MYLPLIMDSNMLIMLSNTTNGGYDQINARSFTLCPT
jgi:hypothetical protein